MLKLSPQAVRFPTPEEVAAMPLEQRQEWFERILGASLGAIEFQAIESCERCEARLEPPDVDYCQRCLALDYEQTSKLMAAEDAQTRKTLKKRAAAV